MINEDKINLNHLALTRMSRGRFTKAPALTGTWDLYIWAKVNAKVHIGNVVYYYYNQTEFWLLSIIRQFLYFTTKKNLDF